MAKEVVRDETRKAKAENKRALADIVAILGEEHASSPPSKAAAAAAAAMAPPHARAMAPPHARATATLAAPAGGMRYVVKGLGTSVSPQRLLFEFAAAESVEVLLDTRTGDRVCVSLVFSTGTKLASLRSDRLGCSLQVTADRVHQPPAPTACTSRRRHRLHQPPALPPAAPTLLDAPTQRRTALSRCDDAPPLATLLSLPRYTSTPS